MQRNGRSSRRSLCRDLALGEGAIKTVVKHMKMNGLIVTSNGGTRMAPRGRAIYSELVELMPSESRLPSCSVALGKFNYAVVVKQLSYLVRSGIEQRDAAIKMGAKGASTLVYHEGKFLMPGSTHDSLRKERKIRGMLLSGLTPADGDVIIIGSADAGEKVAELGAKNAALFTITSLQ
jgi:GTP-dependent phosphoenolpyruvate carboxykinase